MKKNKQITLLQKTSKAFILISGILILVSTPVLYFFISKLMEQEVEEELYSRSYRLEHYVSENSRLLELPPVFEVVKTKKLKPEVLKDTIIYDPSQDEMELFRELSTFKNIAGENYRITVRSMVVETQNIIMVTLIYFLVSLALVFLIQFYFSRAWNRKIWHPFFQNLSAMKAFSLESEKPLSLTESEIKEFSELKEEIAALTSKVISDYQNLKQFTENISHELQTALAIMQAKLENFLNGSSITNEQFSQLSSLQRDIQRLGKLNKKLVLLATLEQRQNKEFEEVNFNSLVKESADNFSEISHITIKIIEKDDLIISSEKELLQVLIDNLINNAIRYNEGSGEIEIEIQKNTFTVKNAGSQKLDDGDRLFNRFYKRDQRSNSGSGLGLAIVKKICDVFHYSLNYSYKDGRHQFEILFE
ncbi:MAG: HAMP domain-containing sensor histidine kinase [Christiangramia sp.]